MKKISNIILKTLIILLLITMLYCGLTMVLLSSTMMTTDEIDMYNLSKYILIGSSVLIWILWIIYSMNNAYQQKEN